jgi:hypothetical protein
LGEETVFSAKKYQDFSHIAMNTNTGAYFCFKYCTLCTDCNKFYVKRSVRVIVTAWQQKGKWKQLKETLQTEENLLNLSEA